MILFGKLLFQKPFSSKRIYNFDSKIALLLLLSKQVKRLFLVVLLLLLTVSVWYTRKINVRNDSQQNKIILATKADENFINFHPEFCRTDLNGDKNIALEQMYLKPEEEITEQISFLEKQIAVKGYSQNSCLLNNLAIIYFIRGYKTNSLGDSLHALSLLDEALTFSLDFTPALFNKALVLQSLHLSYQANTVWEEYLKKETRDKEQLAKAKEYFLFNDKKCLVEIDIWDKEINNLIVNSSNSITKVQNLVSSHPHKARMYVLNELLAKWASAYLKGDKNNSDKSLWLVEQIGINLFSLQKDSLIKDIVGIIKFHSKQKTSSNALSSLAKAYLIYQKSIKSYDNYEVTKTREEVKEAQDIFIKLNDSGGEVLVTLLTTKWNRNYNESISNLEKLALIAEKNNYIYLLGLIWGNIGSFQGHLFQIDLAFKSQNKALQYFQSCGDIEGVATSHFIISEILSQINEKEEIFFHQKKALSILDKSDDPIKKALFLTGIASQIEKLAKPETAIYFHNEAVFLATTTKDEVIITNTLLRRSANYHHLQDDAGAIDDFKKAKTYCSRITDPLFKSLTKEYMDIIEADYELVNDAKHAIELLTASLKTYKNYTDKYYLTHIYQSRAKAYKLLGNKQLALKDLITGIDEFEKQRENISQQGQRIDFFEDSQSIYQQMIEMQIEEGNVEEAFYYVERARARGLLDIINTSNYLNKKISAFSNTTTGIPFSLAEIQSLLPNNTVIIEYCVMEKQTFVWIIGKKKVDFLKIEISQKYINKIVNNIKNNIEIIDKNNLLNDLTKEFYNMIFKPLESYLIEAITLVIVPDKILHDIPFSILINPSTNQYLVQDWTVMYAPSATVFSQCLTKDKEIIKKDDKSLLIISNSFYDKNSSLTNIPFAAKETSQISKVYNQLMTKNAVTEFALLTNNVATKKAFYNLARNYSVIHFAGHGVENEKFPSYSNLVFAFDETEKSTIDNNILYAYELYDFRFTKTRLTILSACRTASGQTKLGEGNISLARSFLAAGVPAVIASSWQIDDQLASEFFIRFHEKKTSGQTSLQALCAVQNEFISSSDPRKQSPIIWGAFILLGGSDLTP